MERKVSFLTESGVIRIKDGETITEGTVLDIVREADRIYNDDSFKDEDGSISDELDEKFVGLFLEGSEFSKLSDRDQQFVLETSLSRPKGTEIRRLLRSCNCKNNPFYKEFKPMDREAFFDFLEAAQARAREATESNDDTDDFMNSKIE